VRKLRNRGDKWERLKLGEKSEEDWKEGRRVREIEIRGEE
jgi:hypothetical protein